MTAQLPTHIRCLYDTKVEVCMFIRSKYRRV